MSYMVRILSPQAVLACAVIVALAACQRSGEQPQSANPPANQSASPSGNPSADQSGQFAWARAALERNPQIEVVSADTQSGVVTIRNRRTGDLQVVRVDELAAAPVSQLRAEAAAPAAPAAEPQAPAAPQEPSTASASTEAATPAQPAAEAAPARTAAGVATAGTPGYTIERADGQVRVSGPGVSIVSAGPVEPAQRAASQSLADPIICEGRRMVHLDNRNIYVEGNAIIARGGCELYITNSHISASGTGIVVQDATVHVSNSQIEGADGSFDADDRAKLFVRSSTFQGVPKRTQLATVQDQGGNRWQ
jgi:hypothetical protein